MYNTKVECTYNTNEIFIETDKVNDKEKEFIRDVIYRQEFLNIFCIEEYNETEINKKIDELYEKLVIYKPLKEIMNKISKKHISSINEKLGLLLLFSYDYMYMSHICISEFLDNGKISEHNILKLKSIVF
jgi:hypothetical protein